MNNSDFIIVFRIFTIPIYINVTHIDDMYGLIKLLPVLSPHLSSEYFKKRVIFVVVVMQERLKE